MIWLEILLGACLAVGAAALVVFAIAITAAIREAREDARVTDYLDR